MNFVLITLALTCFVCVHSATWSYDDPNKWGDNFADCKGNRQSPVDINPTTAMFNDGLVKFVLNGFDSKMQYNITNNGHTIQLNPFKHTMTASGGGLPTTYKVVQFHFHWSDSDTKKGSEHTIKSSSYPLEIHVVQMKAAYSDIKEALKHSDGLAVFGFFFKEGASNKGLAEFASRMPEDPKSSSLVMLSLMDIVGMADMTKYYRYEGSLTTPPCSQAVIWTVFHDVLTASKSEIAAFRKIKDQHNKTISNYRPVQPLNGRKIYTSVRSSGTMATTFSSLLVFFSVFMVTNLW